MQDTPKVIENKEDYGQSSEFKQNAFGLTPDNSKYLSMNNLYNVSGKCGNANVYLLSAGILEKNIFRSLKVATAIAEVYCVWVLGVFSHIVIHCM